MSKLVINNGVYDISTQCGIPNDIPAVATGKDSIGKYSINNINIICSEPDKPTLNPSGILLPLNDNTLYEVPQKNINTWLSKEQDKGGNKQQYSNTCDVAG